MAQVTGGSVTFGRTIQPAQFESKKAEVTITFAVAEDDKPEDARAMLDGAAARAQEKALELVGLKAIKAAAMAQADPLAKATAEPKPDPLAKVQDADRPGAKRGPKTAEKAPEADPLAAAEAAAESVNEAEEAEAHKAAMARANAAVADADGDLLGEAAPQPVTDKELMDAVTKKMAEINNGPAIKAVREKYVPTPKGIRDIPQDKRRAFIEEIAKLTKS